MNRTFRAVITAAIPLLCVLAYYAHGQASLDLPTAEGSNETRLTKQEADEPVGEGECDEEYPNLQHLLELIGPEFNLPPNSLKREPIPEPSNLGEFVKDNQMAIVLGKALFWDMQVGSDGVQACATCHFRAGADPRSVNQLAPGGTGSDGFFDEHFEAKSRKAVVSVSENDATAEGATLSLSRRQFDLKPPNSRLEASDFPFHKLEDPGDRKSRVISDVDDIASSQGVFLNEFQRAPSGSPHDIGLPKDDPIFNVNAIHNTTGLNTRRVEPRNTPTVINSIFNHRNFWDGRAQEIFNGRNVAGVRDENATVIKAYNPNTLVPVKVRIDNASLASLSVGPPLSLEEMSFEGRTFPEIGRRLLRAQPLATQVVDPTDSVLGGFSISKRTGVAGRQGLIDRYEDFIKSAFHEAWWNSDLLVQVDSQGRELFLEATEVDSSAKSYRLVEYNFSLFYGLALQCYMATLVSDDSKLDQHFDKINAGQPGIFTKAELHGLEVFTSKKARCADCHHGPELTGANVRALKRGFLITDNRPEIKPPFAFWQPAEEVERMFIGSCEVAVYNQGFYNIGVRPFTEDLGIGGEDAFGNPLSAAEVLTKLSSISNRELRELHVPRLSKVRAPSLASTTLEIKPVPEIRERERTAVLGAFKMPTLRNVALTAPYFHSGGYLTLRQVVEFYNRGGDFHDWVSPEGIPQDRFMDLGIGALHLTEEEINDLVAFMETMTDMRVVDRSAPFDHPQLLVPNGHRIEEVDGKKFVRDIMVEVPAVGAAGGTPIKGFLEF